MAWRKTPSHSYTTAFPSFILFLLEGTIPNIRTTGTILTAAKTVPGKSLPLINPCTVTKILRIGLMACNFCHL